MANALGTVYELSMRYLVVLFAAEKKAISIDRLLSIDFIASYGADFGLSSENLHGNGSYRYGEYASRKSLSESAIKRLVVHGYVNVLASNKGYQYAISPHGITLCNNLESTYADNYYCIARKAITEFEEYSDSQVERLILNNASIMIEGE